MNTMSMSGYGSPQHVHTPDLLTRLSQEVTGCLKLTSGATTWSIYLEQGKLNYITSSIDPFGRLDRYLRRLSVRIPSLVSAVRVQSRLLFESPTDVATPIGDYQAICWLVEQQHLNSAQAALLIEEMSREVLESLLVATINHHELVEVGVFGELPKFCYMDLAALVEQSQSQLRRRQALEQSTFTPERPAIPEATRELSHRSASPTTNVMPNGAAATRSPGQPVKKTTYTIACIDDSPTVLNAINAFLGDKDFSVVMINDPVKALMQIIRSKPDLILLDVTMPNLDGYELCSLVRKHPSFKNTPVVMVTSNTGFIDRAKARLVGASGYLTKPFTQPDLIKMVFKHLN